MKIASRAVYNVIHTQSHTDSYKDERLGNVFGAGTATEVNPGIGAGCQVCCSGDKYNTWGIT